MTRYHLAVILAAVLTTIVAGFTAFAGEPYDEAALSAMIVITTIPLGVVFAPAVFNLLRGRGPSDAYHPRGRSLDEYDLFGAGVSMLAIALGTIFIRSTFFSDVCASDDSPCYGVVSAITVLFGGWALILKLFAFSLSAISARRRWWMFGAIIFGLLAAIATFWWVVADYMQTPIA